MAMCPRHRPGAPGREIQPQRGALSWTHTGACPLGLHAAAVRLPVEGELPSFDGATGRLNRRR